MQLVPLQRGATRRPAVAALVALARGLQMEHPRAYGGVVDLDVTAAAAGDEQISLPAWRPATVSDVAYSVSVDGEGRCFAARLVPASTTLVRACAAAAAGQKEESRSSVWGPACCVTGGTGGLGLAFARAAAASGEVKVGLYT
jgi:hypothetical protein